MSTHKLSNLKNSFYSYKYIAYGLSYSIWGYISFALITHNEPYYERIILGLLFLTYGLYCRKNLNKIGEKLNRRVSQLIDIVVAIHYYSLMLRSFDWGENFFIAYIFGFLVVMFATGFTTNGIEETFSWSVINLIVAILISFKISFIHPILFLMFIATIISYVNFIGRMSSNLINQLITNTEKTKAILGNMVEGVIVQDSNGKIIELNSESFKILFLNEDEIKNYNFVEKFIYVNEDAKQVCLKNLLSFDQSEMTTGNVFYFKNQFNETRWLKVSWSTFEYSRDFFYITTIEDITKSKLKDKQLQFQKEIANHKAKLASLGELAAGVGHEINNPLAIISGQAQIIKKSILINDNNLNYIDRLEKIEKSIKRIQNITNGMRTFSRADSSEISFFKIDDLVRESTFMLQELFQSDGINLKMNLLGTYLIKGNEGRIRQVLINLLNNAKDAVEFSKNKTIEINLFLENEQVVLKIKDYGSGIDSKIKKIIFQPFFTTKEVGKGTGIGLALANSIIKEHDGEIIFNSEPEKFTEFYIKIPVAKNDEFIAWQTNQNKLFNGTLSEVNKNIKIESSVLIVDDEEDVREIISNMLQFYSKVNIFFASNGVEALDILKTQSIEIIISDIKMPKMDGLELLQKSRLRNYNGKFYFITGGINIDLSDYLEMFNGVIQKPFTEDEILKALVDA